MCAVRALTEGVPATWTFENAGDTTSGVVLKKGNVATDFGPVPFVDLWLGGSQRIRVMAWGSQLRHAIDGAEPQIGDRLQVWFDGEQELTKGPMAGRIIKRFSANVQRGH